MANINGDSGDNELYGSSDYDVIRGGDGDDTIYSSAGNDDLYGEGDSDEFVIGLRREIPSRSARSQDIRLPSTDRIAWDATSTSIYWQGRK